MHLEYHKGIVMEQNKSDKMTNSLASPLPIKSDIENEYFLHWTETCLELFIIEHLELKKF